MYLDATDPGVIVHQRRAPVPELIRGDARYKASIGDAHDVWSVLYDLFPAAEEDDELRERLLEEVNDRRLVVVDRFVGGEPVRFLYSRQLLERELASLLGVA